jgi:hypothetical protein
MKSPLALPVLCLLIPFTALNCGSAGTEAAPAKSSKPERVAPAASTSKDDAGPKCSKSTRNGTYKVQLQGLSSNCQKVADYEEQLKDGIADLSKDCEFDKPDKWTHGNCTLERAYTCKESSGGSTRTILVSTQDGEDGAILVGILSIRKLDKSGSESCQGTYKLIASRP